MKKAILFLSLCMLLYCSGCSVLSYKSNERCVYRKYAYTRNTEQSIRAFTTGQYHELGLNLGALDIIFDSWQTLSKQVAGAAADAGVAYLCYLGVQKINNGNGNGDYSNNSVVINIDSTNNVGDITIIYTVGDKNRP